MDRKPSNDYSVRSEAKELPFTARDPLTKIYMSLDRDISHLRDELEHLDRMGTHETREACRKRLVTWDSARPWKEKRRSEGTRRPGRG